MFDYEASDFVWAVDKYTGHGAPRHRSALDALPGRYKPDEDHPVVDSRGRLLPPEYSTKGARRAQAAPSDHDPSPAGDQPTTTPDAEPEEASA